jgi:hypothetical protein
MGHIGYPVRDRNVVVVENEGGELGLLHYLRDEAVSADRKSTRVA